MRKTIVFLLLTVMVLFPVKVNALSINTSVAGFSDYGEYCDYITGKEFPETFVPFEQISFVGEFESFCHEFYETTPECFWYGVKDSGHLYFYDFSYYMRQRKPYEGYTELESMPDNDLTSCGKSGKYYYRIGNCVYTYRNIQIEGEKIDGYLDNIYIECGDYLMFYWSIPIHKADNLDLSSFSKDSFLYQMLNLETAEAAGERLFNAITGEESGSSLLYWIALPGAAVVIGGAVVTAVMIRKKRKKKAAAPVPGGEFSAASPAPGGDSSATSSAPDGESSAVHSSDAPDVS